MENLFNHLAICNHLYIGNLSQAISLFDRSFQHISSNHCLSQCKLFLASLNLSIYNYILIKENVSLHQCCHDNILLIYNCFDYGVLHHIGLKVIKNYNLCEDYLVEKYHHPEIKKAINYIHEHVHRKITLEEVCCHIGLNKCYFSTLFKKETGIHFSDYVKKTKVHLASKLVRETILPLNIISEQCGFTSYSYFCSIFKQINGVSPTKLRSKKPTVISSRS